MDMKTIIVGLLQVAIPVGAAYGTYEWINADFTVRITVAFLIYLGISSFIVRAAANRKLDDELFLHRDYLDKQYDDIGNLKWQIDDLKDEIQALKEHLGIEQEEESV